jgi:hypothetical protein
MLQKVVEFLPEARNASIMQPKTEEFLNFLLWSAEKLARPTLRNWRPPTGPSFTTFPSVGDFASKQLNVSDWNARILLPDRFTPSDGDSHLLKHMLQKVVR